MNYRYYEQGACFYLNDLGAIFTVRVSGGSLLYYSKDIKLVAPVKQLIESYAEPLEWIDKNGLEVILSEITQEEIKQRISEHLKGKAPLDNDNKLAKTLKIQGKAGFSINRKLSIGAKEKLKRLRAESQQTLLEQYASLDTNHVRFDDKYMKGRISVTGRSDIPNAILMGIRSAGVRNVVREPEMVSDLEISYPDKKLAIILFRVRLGSNALQGILGVIDSKLKLLAQRKLSLTASGYSYVPVWVFESDDCEVVDLESCFGNVLQYLRAVNSLKVEHGCNVELTYGYKHTAFIALQSAKSYFESKDIGNVSQTQHLYTPPTANSVVQGCVKNGGFLESFLLHVCSLEKDVIARLIKNGFTMRSASDKSVNELINAFKLDSRVAAIIYTALNSKH